MIEIILKILFPPRCIGCKAEDSLLCHKCSSNIIKKTSKHDEYKYLDSVYTSCQGTPLLRKLVHLLKYRYKEELVHILGDIMSESVKMFATKDIILVPVPLHFKKKFKRGFNQAEILSEHISSKTGLKNINILKRIVNTKSQAKMNRKDRLENMKNVFKIKNKYLNLSSKTVVLVDDILTTGSTLDSCAEELRRNGFERIYGVCLCRGL